MPAAPKPMNSTAYTTVTHGMRGYFAVMMWWNPDGFWEPLQTGIGSYADWSGAEQEAREWAAAEETEFRA